MYNEQAFNSPIMGGVYLCIWLGAIGLAFIVPYCYLFLLDKPPWNVQSYLYGLVGSMLLFTTANNNLYKLGSYLT